MEKTLNVELASENVSRNMFYYASLELPAKDHEILDAHHRARTFTAGDGYRNICITSCEQIPQLVDVRLDAPNMDELNFLAERLAVLPEDEIAVFQAVFQKYQEDGRLEEPVSMKDLINMTYGLETVSVIGGVWDDGDLGHFVIDNDLDGEFTALSAEALEFLDVEKVGRRMREREGGVFVMNHYVPTEDYEMPEIYNGVTLPSQGKPDTWFAFRLKVAESPVNSANETEETAEWMSLPIRERDAQKIARAHNERDIEDCVCYEFESIVPQITSSHFENMLEFSKLNKLAMLMTLMTPADQVKFKAVLELEEPADLNGILECAYHLDEYDMSAKLDDESSYFQEYLNQHLSPDFDRKWLDSLVCHCEGVDLLKKMGGCVTEYGVIAGRGRQLFELVPCEEEQAQTLDDCEDEELDCGPVMM